MTLSPHLLSVAENANTHQPLAPGDERVENDRFVLWMGSRPEPSWNVVQRLRLEPGSVDATIAEVHDVLRARGRDGCSWEVGSSATPPDLVQRLKARGLVDDDDPHILAMVLQAAPAAVPGIEAGPVRDFAEFLAAARVAWTSFGMERGVERTARSSVRARRPTSRGP
jgi:hypothetical protein